jgi:hypothetical protein
LTKASRKAGQIIRQNPAYKNKVSLEVFEHVSTTPRGPISLSLSTLYVNLYKQIRN